MLRYDDRHTNMLSATLNAAEMLWGRAMTCKLVWEPEGVLAIHAGSLLSGAFLDTVRKIQSDPRFDDARYVIHDFSQVAGHDIASATLTELAILHYGAWASSPNCRVVFVSGDAQLAGAIRRVLGAADLASYECEVRPTLVEARDWLDEQPQLMRISEVMGFLGR